MEGPIDEQTWALFQYTPLAPFGLFVSIDFWDIKPNTLSSWVRCNLHTKIKLNKDKGWVRKERKRTYYGSQEVLEEVFFCKVKFPKRYVNNPSFICSVFNFPLLEFFNSLNKFLCEPIWFRYQTYICQLNKKSIIILISKLYMVLFYWIVSTSNLVIMVEHEVTYYHHNF